MELCHFSAKKTPIIWQVIVTYDATVPADTEERLAERVTGVLQICLQKRNWVRSNLMRRFCLAELAQQMWDGREIMQAALISPEEAVAQAKARLGEVNEKNVIGHGKGTIIFSDAADATTSGASGNSNQLLRALVEGGYTGSVLFPIVDPDAVAAAKLIGEGSSGEDPTSRWPYFAYNAYRTAYVCTVYVAAQLYSIG